VLYLSPTNGAMLADASSGVDWHFNRLLESVKEIQADHIPELEAEGIVVNQFQPHASLPQRTVEELIEEGLPVLQPYLNAGVRIKESHGQESLEQPRLMIQLDPRHEVTQEFVALHQALARRRAPQAGRR